MKETDFFGTIIQVDFPCFDCKEIETINFTGQQYLDQLDLIIKFRKRSVCDKCVEKRQHSDN